MRWMRNLSVLIVALGTLAACSEARPLEGGDRNLVGREAADGAFVDQPGVIGEPVDCTEAYGTPERCVRVACPKPWSGWIGEWRGPFVAHIDMPRTEEERRVMLPFYDELKGAVPGIALAVLYRPYTTKLVYYSKDCLRHETNGDELAIGRQVDEYPEFQKMPKRTRVARIVSGRHANGADWLRTYYDDEGALYYRLVKKQEDTDLWVWECHVDEQAPRPALTWRILDGRDMTVTDHEKRMLNVSLKIEVGGALIWNGIVGSGQHDYFPPK